MAPKVIWRYVLVDFVDLESLRIIPMIRLHEPAYMVSFNVENSGPVYGGEVRYWQLLS